MSDEITIDLNIPVSCLIEQIVSAGKRARLSKSEADAAQSTADAKTAAMYAANAKYRDLKALLDDLISNAIASETP